MTRHRNKDVSTTTRAAWGEVVALLTRDELVALNYTVTRELTRRNRQRREQRNACTAARPA